MEHPLNARRAHAAAPVRLDLAGAWTDVPPFSQREGGTVVSAAIDLKVHVNILPGGDTVQLLAEDLGVSEELGDGPSRLPMLAHAVRRLPVGGATIVSRSDAPPGSGLGTSGAMGVAMMAAMHHARGEPVVPELEFHDPALRTEPIALDAGFADELERAMVLCYTGVSRVSGDTISRVMSAYERGDPGVTAALRALRALAADMLAALREGCLDDVARILARNWALQQQLDPAMCTPEMRALELAVRNQGALGGKAAGSGAGGCMFFLAPGCRAAVEAAARESGASILRVRWAREGVTTW